MAKPKPASCYIGPEVHLQGTLKFEGLCIVQGTVEGRIESDGLLDVSPTGRVNAEVEVGEVLCRGRVEGSITARRRMDLLAGCEVEAALQAAWLTIQEGAFFRGPVTMERPTGLAPRSALPLAGRRKASGLVLPLAVAAALAIFVGGWLLTRSKPSVAMPPPAGLLESAETYLEQKDYSRARYLYESAFQAQPQDERAVLGLANVAFAQGRTKEAIEYYERVLTLSPKHTAVQRRLGELYSSAGNPTKALQYYESVLKRDPDDEKSLLSAADLYQQVAKPSKALALYERFRKLYPRRLEVPARLAALFVDQGKFGKATEIYEELLAQRPDDLDLKLALAGARLEAGDEQGASELFAEVAAKEPNRMDTLRTAADLHLKLGERKKAMQTLERAAKAMPDDLNLRLTLAELYNLQNQPDKALGHLKVVLKQDPSNLDAALKLADNLRVRGRTSEALEHLEAAALARPGNAEIQYRIGDLHYELKQWDKAKEALLKAIETDPNHAEALNRLAWIYAVEGSNLDKAIKLSRRSLEVEPSSPGFLDTLAEIHYQRKEYQDAIRLIQQAIDQAPKKKYFKRQLAKFQRAARRKLSGS